MFTDEDFKGAVEEWADIKDQKDLNSLMITEITVLMDFDSWPSVCICLA